VKARIAKAIIKVVFVFISFSSLIYIFHILLSMIFFFATTAEEGFIKPPASLIKTAD